jgi:uncharacterized protein
MTREVIEAVITWQSGLHKNEGLEITFHGGEPLLAGGTFYCMALPLLAQGLAALRVRFSVQSNLWLLNDELCELFKAYQVSLGTSLDGPQHINDVQRGAGYFQRTMVGIAQARAHGLEVGCICTLTAQSLPHVDEIMDFFICEGLDFSLHAALPSLQYPSAAQWALSPEEHGEALLRFLDRYLLELDKVRISTLDSLCRGISAGQGSICTFGNCLGGFLAVDPQGGIYPCQRFAGNLAYRMTSVYSAPTWEDLSATSPWQMLHEREQQIAEECGGCNYFDFCRGGCPYNALAVNGGSFKGHLRDPHCPAYKKVFSSIIDQALGEVFSSENLAEVVEHPNPQASLLRRGRLLNLMRGKLTKLVSK